MSEPCGFPRCSRSRCLIRSVLLLTLLIIGFVWIETRHSPGTGSAAGLSGEGPGPRVASQYTVRPDHAARTISVRVWESDLTRPYGITIRADQRSEPRTLVVRDWSPRPPSYRAQVPVPWEVTDPVHLVDRIVISTPEAYECVWYLPVIPSEEIQHDLVLPPRFEVVAHVATARGPASGVLEVRSLSEEFPGALRVQVEGGIACFALRRAGVYGITWRPRLGSPLERRVAITSGELRLRW